MAPRREYRDDSLARTESLGGGYGWAKITVGREEQGPVVPLSHPILDERGRDTNVCFLFFIVNPLRSAEVTYTAFLLKSPLNDGDERAVNPQRIKIRGLGTYENRIIPEPRCEVFDLNQALAATKEAER
jgi:hypothetical protein